MGSLSHVGESLTHWAPCLPSGPCPIPPNSQSDFLNAKSDPGVPLLEAYQRLIVALRIKSKCPNSLPWPASAYVIWPLLTSPAFFCVTPLLWRSSSPTELLLFLKYPLELLCMWLPQSRTLPRAPPPHSRHCQVCSCLLLPTTLSKDISLVTVFFTAFVPDCND